MLTSSIIIPTYNRISALSECIESILYQTRFPDELLIIDDGNISELPYKQEIEKAGIKYIYYKKKTPGLTESRNKGIELATGKIILFLDDDVVLYRDYIEEILKIYESDMQGLIGGAGGWPVNAPPLRWWEYLQNIYYIIFLNKGLKEGRVLPSGFCTELAVTEFRLKNMTEVEFLGGAASSYRKKIFDEFSFTARYREFAFGEDKDFSHRVSMKYKLIVNPDAKLIHYMSKEMRPDKKKTGYKFVIGKYLLFRNYKKTGWWSYCFFYYALAGYIGMRIIMMVLSMSKNEFKRLQGIFKAINDIWSGELPG